MRLEDERRAEEMVACQARVLLRKSLVSERSKGPRSGSLPHWAILEGVEVDLVVHAAAVRVHY